MNTTSTSTPSDVRHISSGHRFMQPTLSASVQSLNAGRPKTTQVRLTRTPRFGHLTPWSRSRLDRRTRARRRAPLQQRHPGARHGAVDQWTPISVPDTVIKSPTDLIHVNGQFWATGTTGRVPVFAGSRDLERRADAGHWHTALIIHANGRYVAVGDKLTIASSPTGTSDWTVPRPTRRRPATTSR